MVIALMLLNSLMKMELLSRKPICCKRCRKWGHREVDCKTDVQKKVWVPKVVQDPVSSPWVPAEPVPVVQEHMDGMEPVGDELRTVAHRRQAHATCSGRAVSPVALANSFDRLDKLEEFQIGEGVVRNIPGPGSTSSQDHG